MRKLLFVLLLAPVMALASGGDVHLDKAPVDMSNKASLQRGAETFVTYCLNCHSAAYMRYNRLKDIGLTEEQIKAKYMFAAEKTGETMNVAMSKKDAKEWFGATPPDLTVISRARGADWLYTYLRTFYRDETRPTGWNNVVFDKVGMPHILYQFQGEQVMQYAEGKGEHAGKLVLAKPGTLKPAEYDAMVGDLVNYLVFMGEPIRQTRQNLGWIVLAFLGVFFVLSYALYKEYWKDIH